MKTDEELLKDAADQAEREQLKELFMPNPRDMAAFNRVFARPFHQNPQTYADKGEPL